MNKSDSANKLEQMAAELAAFYGLEAAQIREGLQRAIHDGMSLKAAEMIFISVMQDAGHGAPPRYYNTADMMEISGLTYEQLEAEIDAYDRAHPDTINGYILPGTPKMPQEDFRPHPDQPDEHMITARGVMLMAILDTKNGTGTPKTATMTRKLFERVAVNGYGVPAWELQREIMGRDPKAIKEWIRAIYDVYITGPEVMSELQTI